MPSHFANRLQSTDYRKRAVVSSSPRFASEAGQKAVSKFTPAFTLIEVLVVVALIGVLATFTVFTVISAQRKARDAQRKSDLALVKRALEQAKNDCKNAAYYPLGIQQYLLITDSFDYQRFVRMNADLKSYGYIGSTLTDPTENADFNDPESSLYYYGFDYDSTNVDAVCPDSSGTLTLAGSSSYWLRTKLESRDDAELKKSWLACQSQIINGAFFFAIGLPGRTWTMDGPKDLDGNNIDDNGYFYICND